MRKITRFIGLKCLAVLFCALVLGMSGCGGGSSATDTAAGGDDATSEQATDASENNASRALDTSGMSVTTTIPSN